MGLPSVYKFYVFHHKPVRISLFTSTYAKCSIHLFHLDLITRIIFGDKYKTLWIFLRSPATSSHLLQNIFPRAIFSRTCNQFLLLAWQAKFSTHVKQHANVYIYTYFFFSPVAWRLYWAGTPRLSRLHDQWGTPHVLQKPCLSQNDLRLSFQTKILRVSF